ncbi:glutamine synthetase family protein [Nocardia sp. NPDC058640]|uniref:glutamine synthetase family protein n=1 Tax=Nocardia sp. NPDC058640 TaxID=3346571 RepID=UPI0036628F21
MRHPRTSKCFESTTVGSHDFVRQYGLWTDDQYEAARCLEAQLEDLDFVRLVFCDPHGLARSKMLTAEAFRVVLRNGMDFSPGPFIFDTAHTIPFDIFAEGAELGVPELTGAGDFLLVPDPLTFRELPYTSARTGWVIGDEYLRDGLPHPLSGRAALRRLTNDLGDLDREFTVGLEVEWYLTKRTSDTQLASVGRFGTPGEPPCVNPVNTGYQFNHDGYIDALEPVLHPLSQFLLTLDLPLRTIEHESGPGQLEFTFAPLEGLAAADAMLLFRTVTKQVCARLGYHASFMAVPPFPGFDTSGWHLHQSLAEKSSRRNTFVDTTGRNPLSDEGMSYLAGIIENASAATVMCVSTLNGYRRLGEQNTLSPDRIGWAVENRGAFLRVLGGFGAASTHIENRIGEPCANPYLYLASQLAAGLDGVRRGALPPPQIDDPHSARASELPRDLATALCFFEASDLYKRTLGDPLSRLLINLKNSELERYRIWTKTCEEEMGNLDWDKREYFANY